MEEFSEHYKKVDNLPMENDSLNKLNKPKLIESLMIALTALKLADVHLKKQADLIMKTNMELLKQCELSRTLSENCNSKNGQSKDPPTNSKNCSDNASYSETVKTSLLVLKPTTSTQLCKDQITNQMSQALGKTKVSSAKVTDNGKIVVNIPNTECQSEVKNSLLNTFSDNFCFEENKKIMPKITVTGVPVDMSDEALLTEICAKDTVINNEINKNAVFSVVKTWTNKNRPGSSRYKNVLVKCSPEIRNHVIKNNDGYLYVGLTSCKTFDHFFVPQCFHCYKFNHFARDCPDKDKPQTCGRCSGNHKTNECRNNNRQKCVNCSQSRGNDFKHFSYSKDCPSLLKAKELVFRRTNYESEKN